MAYERTWNFCPVVGPRVPASATDDMGYLFWVLKSYLRGEMGGATQGLWTCEGSSDGSTAGMDGVDRWTATYSAAKIPFGLAAANRGWMVLKSPVQPNGVYAYLLLTNSAITGGVATLSCMANLPFTGGTITTNPTSSSLISRDGLTNITFTPNDVANPARYYAALSSTGDFWFLKTRLGFAENAVILMSPVGCKGTDQGPLYGLIAYTAGANALSGNVLFVPDAVTNQTKRWNGSAGNQCLVQPPAISLLDAADTSLFDFPAWVVVGNGATISVFTQMHARGRLPDAGLCGGGNAGPVASGNAIKDAGGNIKYVTSGCMLLPYNAPLT
jgi:hypothetical protein